MRISRNWLKEFVDVDMTSEELADALTMLGLEVESVERLGEGISNIVVGRIVSVEPHPDADNLVVCRTDIGQEEPLQIVCGAPNATENAVVPTALAGAELPNGLKIAKRKVRGVESCGMMCSEVELGLGEDHSGLMHLSADLEPGQDIVAALGLDDAVFEIEVTPNRADWASMIGVARELAVLCGKELHLPAFDITEEGKPASGYSSVIIENPDLCPRYIGRIITGVRIGPSPDWLCKRLIAAGQRPINNIVDITNYVLLETGHPLHAFDYDLLAENRIVVRNPSPGETIKTIDGETRKLSPEMLVIADAKIPVAVAGIMGGLESEVGETTQNVFLESAYFEPVSVRRTARALGMQTEASQRFQRGADPEMAQFAIDRAAQLMHEIAGGTIAPGRLDAHPKPLTPAEVTLRFAQTSRLLGAEIKSGFQRNTLEKLGFEMLSSDADTCTVSVPLRRNDVSREVDLIEEIARFHGYENIPTLLPRVRVGEQVFAPHYKTLRSLRNLLLSSGLTEFVSMSFGSPGDVRRAALPDTYADLLPLANPLSEHHAGMRTSLIPALLAAASRNLRYGVVNIHAFEVAPVYQPKAGSELPDQTVNLGVLLAGNEGTKHWSQPLRPLDLYDLKGHIEDVLAFLGAPAIFIPDDLETFERGRSGRIELDERPVGCFGQVAQAVLGRYDIEQPIYLAELSLDPLLALQRTAPAFEPVAQFPPSLRDMAVVVDASTQAADIRDAAEKAGGKLLRRADIFDIYTGGQVPPGKKSVALNLVFQSHERTLTDKDTQKTFDKILRTLKREFGAELR